MRRGVLPATSGASCQRLSASAPCPCVCLWQGLFKGAGVMIMVDLSLTLLLESISLAWTIQDLAKKPLK